MHHRSFFDTSNTCSQSFLSCKMARALSFHMCCRNECLLMNWVKDKDKDKHQVPRRHLFLVAMNVCWRAPEKRPLCLKRLSDANAPQSHQRDPTFVTPPAPTLQHIWGQIFHVYVLDLSTKHYSTPTLQQIRGQIFHIYFLFLSTKHYSTPTVQHFKGQIFHVYALYLSTSHYATPTFLDWNLDFKGTCHGIIRLDQPFPS